MNKLFPPILKGSLPAFTKTGLVIPYEMNRGVSFNSVTGFSVVIKSTITNQIIKKIETNTVTSGQITVPIPKDLLNKGQFYKIQLAFMSEEEVGYYSDVSIAKYIEDSPSLEVKEEDGVFTGIYSCGDPTERLYSYTFNLYDSDGKLIESSGELLHNATKDVGTVSYDTWTPKFDLDNGSNYKIQFLITTMNNYSNSFTKTISAKKDEAGYIPQNIELKALQSENGGSITLKICNSRFSMIRRLIYGKFKIFKTSSKDNYKSKYLVAYFTLENQDIFEQTFKDYTVESGYSYQYILQQVNDYGIYSEEIYSDIIEVHFEHMYLFDGERQLTIMFNPDISTFKNNILETKMDTIGSQYPFILRNGKVSYKEFNLSGLISYQMDEQNEFCSDKEIWDWVSNEEIMPANSKAEWTHNLTDRSIAAEKQFKLKVYEWLQNGKLKMLKTPTEGNYLIRLMNVTLSPNKTVGRMLHSFSATGYEIENVDKHSFAQALTMNRNNKYIGYETVPLYDFPKYRLAIANDNKYEILYDNRLYEIISSPITQYVVAARFEDVKPGTEFKIVLERNNIEQNFSISIGATGFYAIPKELGFHIKSIRLTKEDWEQDTPEANIINNRGQVTYEYEQQADHNNFNDITEVIADTAICVPWYSTWAKTYMIPKVYNLKGENEYSPVKVVSQINQGKNALFKMGCFEDKIGKNFYFGLEGIDYEKRTYTIEENGEITEVNRWFWIKDGNELEVVLSKNKGQIYLEGETIPFIEKIEEYDKSQKTQDLNGKYILKYEQFIDDKIEVLEQDNEYIEKEIPIYQIQTNAQGTIQGEIATETQIINPFYGVLIDNENKMLQAYMTKEEDKYLIEPGEKILESNSLSLTTCTMYKNYVPNKYYPYSNLQGEFYLKEDISNIYSINFELINVFYQEELNGIQNFYMPSAKAYFKDVYDGNNNFSHIERRFEGSYNTSTNIEDSKKVFLGNEESWKDALPPIKKQTEETQPTYVQHNSFYYLEDSEYFQTIKEHIENNLNPNSNEIIIVKSGDKLNYPVRIDLTNRFSYSLNLEEGFSFDDIEGIYIGKNVRGFATYKRKAYSYKALIADGTYVDLNYKEGDE